MKYKPQPRLSVTNCSMLIVFMVLVFLTSTTSSSASSRKFGPSDAKTETNSSFFWRIDSSPPSYMFGTIHVPYTRVWDAIPDNVKKAFELSKEVWFELDFTKHETLTALSMCQILPNGQPISAVIPSDLYLRIKLHLDYVRKAIKGWMTKDQKDRGVDPDYLFNAFTANWERKRPIWVMMMINSLTKADVGSRGVPVLDLLLSRMAKRNQKSIGAIEKVEEQCQPLNALRPELVIFALNQTLNYHENLKLGNRRKNFLHTDDLIDQYRRGTFDANFLTQDTFQVPVIPMRDGEGWGPRESQLARELDQYFKTNLIDKRNKRMAARVIDLLVNKPNIHFFAFGAGHFLGKNSIVDLVRSAGFTVEQIKPGQSLQTRIQGTFDDLSEDEKTRVLLQFLQYRHQLEENESHQSGNTIISSVVTTTPSEEKAIEKSIEVWYGVNSASATIGPTPMCLCLLTVLCAWAKI